MNNINEIITVRGQTHTFFNSRIRHP